jgi:4-amino-4-deoxy-L-arabinose transferase-like glycosyltransferase
MPSRAAPASREPDSRPAAALVLAAAALLLLPGLARPDLWAPDEPRYAQVAEEVRQGAGHRVLLHLDGEPYGQKPPLYFWLAALAGAPGGRVTERAARLPSALAGLAVVALTLALGTALLGRRSGVLGAALLVTLPAFARLARRAQLDVLLALLELAALAAYARGAGRPELRRRDLAGLHAALGLAVLCKGPVGALVPLLALAAHRVWEGSPRPLRGLAPPACLLLSLGPALAWLAASAALAPAGFLREAVAENVLGRFFLGTSHARPPTYYLRQLPLDFLPWTLLWPALIAAGRRVFAEPASPRASAWRLLLCWVGAAVAFLSLSSGKRGLYLIPAFPALALLCADAAGELLPDRGRVPGWERALGFGLVAAALAAAALLPGRLAEHGLAAPGASAALVAAAALALALRRAFRRRPRAAFASSIGLVLAAELVAAFLVLPALDPQKSPRPVAEAAAALAPPGTPVATARPSLVGALRYYGGRRVRRVESAAELHRFLAEGGAVIVLPASRLGLVTREIPVEVRARLRTGKRALLVVTPLAGSDGERVALGYAPAPPREAPP